MMPPHLICQHRVLDGLLGENEIDLFQRLSSCLRYKLAVFLMCLVHGIITYLRAQEVHEWHGRSAGQQHPKPYLPTYVL